MFYTTGKLLSPSFIYHGFQIEEINHHYIDNNSIETFSNQAGFMGQTYTPRKPICYGQIKNFKTNETKSPALNKKGESVNQSQSDFSKTLSIETIISGAEMKTEEETVLFDT